MTSSNSEIEINNISPNEIVGGVGKVLTIEGIGFNNIQGDSYISFKQESGEYMDEIESKKIKYIFWSNNSIKIEMPCAYSGEVKICVNGLEFFSEKKIYVKANLGYTNLNPLQYCHLINQNGKGGYTWSIHTSLWNIPEARIAIEEVIQEFREDTGVNFILEENPTDAEIDLNNNINLITLDPTLNCPGHFFNKYWDFPMDLYNFRYTQTMIIHFSDKEQWYFGKGKIPEGKSKFRYVLLHELCHSVGLGHVNEEGQTMFHTVTMLPSNNWSYRDRITEEEKIAILHFINNSQNFTFSPNGILPLKKIDEIV
ncbi:MAG: hypothetical protein CFE25_10495 [Chitinophagaceae bacterium BSSC1]|nr:MAG: hypothetical protein CFE25_10495 [Chitinophagaceae bacterium BSSC1]